MTIATLFNLAGPDLILILFVLALFGGARRLPDMAKSVGHALREFNKARVDPE